MPTTSFDITREKLDEGHFGNFTIQRVDLEEVPNRCHVHYLDGANKFDCYLNADLILA